MSLTHNNFFFQCYLNVFATCMFSFSVINFDFLAMDNYVFLLRIYGSYFGSNFKGKFRKFFISVSPSQG